MPSVIFRNIKFLVTCNEFHVKAQMRLIRNPDPGSQRQKNPSITGPQRKAEKKERSENLHGAPRLASGAPCISKKQACAPLIAIRAQGLPCTHCLRPI